MNQFKAKLFPSNSELQQYRILIEPYELDQFWGDLCLLQMERIFTIDDPVILQIVTSFLQCIIPERRINQKDAYYVYNNGEVKLIVYDCKIFKHFSNDTLDNQFISSLILSYRNSNEISAEIHQFIDTSIFQNKDCVLKCKQSCILRLYAMIKQFNLQGENSDIIVIPEKYYLSLIRMWIPNHMDFGLQFNVICLFKAILVIMQNQIYLNFFHSLTQQEKYERQYNRPVKKIKKPKNKSQFTMPQKNFGEVRWQQLKIQVFRLKYKIVERQQEYLCYREKQQAESLGKYDFTTNLYELSQQDQNILMAFQLVAQMSIEN